MPPKLTDDGAKDIMLKYLQTQNRPYSAIDVFNNLHGEVGKSQVVKVLTTMAEEGLIIEKEYGKQKVYCALQADEDVDEKEMAELEARVVELTDQLQEATAEVKALEQKKAALASSLTTEELAARLEELEKKIAKNEATLAELKAGKSSLSKKDIEAIDKHYQQSLTQWRKRKRMCTDIMDMILESYPKKKKDLVEEVGLETDEEVGVDIATATCLS